ncbi:hypothetical protein [Dokdonella sp.]|nr:hypothetical protein [Dokdonella sp.]MBO9661551.1 hypothetical protein [Dokdonella sp.]
MILLLHGDSKRRARRHKSFRGHADSLPSLIGARIIATVVTSFVAN